MLITYPLNVDYMITDVRVRVGDVSDTPSYSDSLVRSSILAGVKMLQRRWSSRYVVFVDEMVVSPLPAGMVYQADYDALVASGESVAGINTIVPYGYVYGRVAQGYAYIPSGLRQNDVFRNPYHTFTDPGAQVFSQEDEEPIILAATIVLRAMQISSSASTFQSWSDGEYSFSNIAASNTMRAMYVDALAQLDAYFKKRLSSAIRESFPMFVP